ncbi:hypothetical protein DFH11DRAFT_1879232 [Phellopilus nigrolimitatus]|nr:hypothetical protein DFH11DRAFT_1879232 [Phellopilus nigrolimitatus]
MSSSRLLLTRVGSTFCPYWLSACDVCAPNSTLENAGSAPSPHPFRPFPPPGSALFEDCRLDSPRRAPAAECLKYVQTLQVDKPRERECTELCRERAHIRLRSRIATERNWPSLCFPEAEASASPQLPPLPGEDGAVMVMFVHREWLW